MRSSLVFAALVLSIGLAGVASCRAAEATGASTAAETSAPTRPVLFVGNLGDGTVTLVGEDTLEALGSIDVIPDGNTPRDPRQAAIYPSIIAAKGTNFAQGLAVSSDGRRLYVARGYLGDVAAFDLATRQLVWRFQIDGIRADHIALSPDGQRLFVSAITASKVEVLDAQRGSLVGAFVAGTYPHVLRFTPDGQLLAVGSMGDPSAPTGSGGERTLSFVGPDSLEVRHRITFDAGVRPFAFSPDGATAYVQLSFLNGLRAVDTASGNPSGSVELPVEGPALTMDPADYPNQAAHHGIALSGDGESLCVAATVSNYVGVLDRKSLSLKFQANAVDQPAEAEASLDGRCCFVTNRGPNGRAVQVIAFADGGEVKRLPMGDRPQEMSQAEVPVDVLAGAVGKEE
jgi:DNA-binding beta-propeller fold protein YncE